MRDAGLVAAGAVENRLDEKGFKMLSESI